jgi:predicted DNA binding CopG/RHH family protein
MKYIDKEEKELIESYKKGEWKSVKKKNQKIYEKAAKESIAKTKRINIRLTPKDYHDIQVKAIEEGIPYQTLISSIIHKYNKGELKSTLVYEPKSKYGKNK